MVEVGAEEIINLEISTKQTIKIDSSGSICASLDSHLDITSA